MTITEQALLAALQTVVDPNTGSELVTGKQVKNLRIEGGDVSFDVQLGYPAKSQVAPLRKALVTAARTVPGVNNVSANISWKIVAHAVQRGVQLLPRVIEQLFNLRRLEGYWRFRVQRCCVSKFNPFGDFGAARADEFRCQRG